VATSLYGHHESLALVLRLHLTCAFSSLPLGPALAAPAVLWFSSTCQEHAGREHRWFSRQAVLTALMLVAGALHYF
jgi:hypothetical protein